MRIFEKVDVVESVRLVLLVSFFRICGKTRVFIRLVCPHNQTTNLLLSSVSTEQTDNH